jgi:hypothetical protein
MAIPCNRGTLRRKSYTRTSYTRKNGIHVRRARVRSACIKAGIADVKSGKLSRHGYSSSGSTVTRHTALNKAIKVYGALAVYQMLNAVYVYSKRTTPAKSGIYKADRDWVGAGRR